MKKLFMIALMTFIGMNVQAQSVKGDMAAGVNVAYGTKDGFSNFGIGAKLQYNLTDALRIEPSATYFFKKDFVSMWDANVNLHYLISIAEKFSVYPLAGISLVGVKAEVDGFSFGGYEIEGASASETKFGANLGAGAQYWLTETFALNFDFKYQLVSDFNRPVFSLGGVFKF
ncbi:MAG: porin family protein [Mediterranea massiliensis]|nr:porin family protein [Mediterranea massiliensis]